MRVLVAGANGRTGRILIEEAQKLGHDVVALARKPIDGFDGKMVVGTPTNRIDLLGALDGVQSVFGCLASNGVDQVCLNATRLLQDCAPNGLRYVLIGGAAVDAENDAKGAMDRLASRVTRLFAGKMVAERQAELASLRASHLNYTFLRPPQLVDKTARNAFAFTFDKPAHFRISRRDLALAMLAAAGDDALKRKAPFVSWPK
ncbi:MAG: NAD(P)-binding oxidoreductase [Pseudomonadota bacterium]